MKDINYFPVSTIEHGNFKIEDGIIAVQQSYLIGQHIYIPGATQGRGSILNAGVYLVSDDKITLTGARDEAFAGAVCSLAIDQDFLDLAAEIETFEENARNDKNRGMLTSESFGGYSYSMATTASGVAASWKEVYASRLNSYRCMFPPIIF